MRKITGEQEGGGQWDPRDNVTEVREGLGRVVQVEGETRANPGWWDGLPMFQN